MSIKRLIKLTFVSLFALTPLASSVVSAQETKAAKKKIEVPLHDYLNRFHPVMARKGMVVAQEKHATEAGYAMIAQGGNAIDAAVATGFALAVTYPQAGNIGGGGFLLAYIAKEDKVIALDFREMAPGSAHRDMFLKEDGSVDRRKAMFSAHSSGVPGTVKGLIQAHKKYGSLPLQTVMGPAIKLAEEGFLMPWGIASSIAGRMKRLSADKDTARYFFKADGSAYEAGELFVQKDLAKTLQSIADKGADGFYRGWVADKIVEKMKETGGIISHEDLKNYKAVERTAVRSPYRGYEVVSMPPPSSGGVHIVQMMNVLEGYDLRSFGHNSADYIHTVTEAMKHAYADRSEYLGDPDYWDVPVEKLTSKAYAAQIRAKIMSEKATPSQDIKPGMHMVAESPQTTHLSSMDAAGNAVSLTYTLNFSYGNGMSVGGAGFLLNNEMDDFSAKPGVPNGFGLLGGEANAIAAGKRPLSSMTPTMVLKEGKPFFVTGSPGGSRIINAVLQTILNTTDFNMGAASAVSVPRFHHQWMPDEILVESGISIDTIRILQSRGQNIDPYKKGGWRTIGAVQAIMRTPDGLMHGAADPRRQGAIAIGE
ncbi:gamma-glutamyltransferase [Temperatibacter marinus]|uniref:Glutathione hydrolase proenzyme n=1 Tax=Temperatibacter marinus TaxID=1456591 RepID=A0AA52EB21_9PROT|nr:gamma-glutamyltransferase [Temperatibacter marinus]WND01455.1 gamma-glutamyltransferase [Temperatibacter marinus]